MSRKQPNPNPPIKMEDEFILTNIPISFGDKVKDMITGYTGIIQGIHYMYSGCIRWELCKENSIENVYVDAPKLIKKYNGDLPQRKPFKFEIGQIVKDRLTNKKFAVMKQYQHITGYNRYYCRVLKPKTMKEFDMYISFEENELIKSSYYIGFNKVKNFKDGIKLVEEKKIVRSPINSSRIYGKY